MVDTTITRGLNGKWSLATYSACRRCAPLATSTSWSNPYSIDTICPSTSRWICPSSGARRVVVSWMIRPPFSASRTRSLVLVMTDPGNGCRICSVAVEWGRGWFTAGAAACLPRMPQPAASTRMLIAAARAARDIVNGLLGRSKPSVIPTNLVRRRLRPAAPKYHNVRCAPHRNSCLQGTAMLMVLRPSPARFLAQALRSQVGGNRNGAYLAIRLGDGVYARSLADEHADGLGP